MSLNPHEFPELYGKLYVDGVESPGVCRLTGHDRDQKVDIQEPKGSVGASAKHQGEKLGQFQASFYLADAEAQDAWPAFKYRIEASTFGPDIKALQVWHPDLAENRYSEVTNGGVSGLVWDSKGGATALVKFIEYRPPEEQPAAEATSSGATDDSGTGEGSTYDPNAEARATLNGLLDDAGAP